jgi:hypothetical protein
MLDHITDRLSDVYGEIPETWAEEYQPMQRMGFDYLKA